MTLTKRILFYFICILILLFAIELISGYLITLFLFNERLQDHSRIRAIAILEVIYQKYFPEEPINDRNSKKFILNNGNFKKTLNDESMRDIYERVYDGRSIEKIRNEWASYHNQIFSYRPNNLDYLMTVNPKVKNNDGIIIMGNRGERQGIANHSKNECWVFGGSTAWGDLLHGDETITSFLNQLQNRYEFLNYGVPGYNSNSQLKYFIYLLKSRQVIPKCVVWLDGINDGGSIWLRPAVKAVDRTSHSDRPSSRIVNLSNQFISLTPDGILKRDKKVMDSLLILQRFDLTTLNKVNSDVQEYLLTNKKLLLGDEYIINEAALNHIDNARIARAILREFSEGKSNFYWFIQPNGELNRSNPFLMSEHYESNRFLIGKYYQKLLIEKSQGFAIDLTKFESDCIYCYVDQAHYSPAFSKKIAAEIIKALH